MIFEITGWHIVYYASILLSEPLNMVPWGDNIHPCYTTSKLELVQQFVGIFVLMSWETAVGGWRAGIATAFKEEQWAGTTHVAYEALLYKCWDIWSTIKMV